MRMIENPRQLIEAAVIFKPFCMNLFENGMKTYTMYDMHMTGNIQL